MPKGKANCAVCGKPLVYSEEARDLTCAVCGKVERGRSFCQAGHYVCDACHRKAGVESIMGICSQSTSKDPVEMAMEAMDGSSVYPNGPEHHTLVGAVIIAAYANAGGGIDKADALAELKERSMQLPGGTCGYWGVCGAAASAGQAMSIINGSTPLTAGPWAQCQRLTSLILGRLADIGGPRCCKRSTFAALEVAVPYVNGLMGVRMELPGRIVCRYMAGNAQCIRRTCPYFPGRRGRGDAER